MADNIKALTQEGLQKFAEEILTTVNTRIGERIVDTVNANSDATHMPSAEAVYTAINGISHILPLVIGEDGSIDDVDITPDSKTLYIARKKATDTTGTAYIYVAGTGYINLGSTGDVSGTDLAVITDQEIVSAVAAASLSTTPDLG